MKPLLSLLLCLTFMSCLISCSNSDDDSSNTVVEAPRISGGPFMLCLIDDEPDSVTGLSVNGGVGDDFTWVVTDDQNVILRIPKTVEDTEAVDFSEAGQGNCRLWLLRFNTPIESLQEGNNLIADLNDEELEGLSNFIEVLRTVDPEICNTL